MKINILAFSEVLVSIGTEPSVEPQASSSVVVLITEPMMMRIMITTSTYARKRRHREALGES